MVREERAHAAVRVRQPDDRIEIVHATYTA